jgi:hypothetical protein
VGLEASERVDDLAAQRRKGGAGGERTNIHVGKPPSYGVLAMLPAWRARSVRR